MRLLTKKDIIEFNKDTASIHGGNYVKPSNFLHEENLDYLIKAVNSELFGEPMYPSIPDKAAVYCYNIICNHIFSDGNKRTGLLAALNFLNDNNFDINEKISNDDMTAFIISIASGEMALDECRDWFEKNTIGWAQIEPVE